MAVNKAGVVQSESLFAIKAESTFGTATADSGAFDRIDAVDGAVPSFQPTSFTDDRIKGSGKTTLDINDVYQTQNGIAQTLQLPTCLGRADDLAQFVYLAAQNVSEAATTPFVKTYTFDGANKPDFSAGAGYFATALIKEPFSGSYSTKLTSRVCNNLTINFDALNEGGRFTFTGTLFGGSGYETTSNPSGTQLPSTVDAINFQDSNGQTLSIGGEDLVCFGGSINIETIYTPTGYDGGDFLNLQVSTQKLTGQFIVKYDVPTQDFDAKLNTDAGAFAFAVSTDANVGYFALDSAQCFMRNITRIRGGNNEVQKLALDLEFMIDESGSNYATIKIADGVDQTW